MRLILRHETFDFGRGPKLAVLKSFVLRTPLYTYKVVLLPRTSYKGYIY